MKYRADIDRWISKDGQVYRYDKYDDKLKLCSENDHHGYSWCSGWINGKRWSRPVHRLVWETFKGEIPEDKEIDHQNNNRKDNTISNLQLVTHAENNRLRFVRGFKYKGNGRHFLSEFGELFFKKYGFGMTTDINLYSRERRFWKKHGRLIDG